VTATSDHLDSNQPTATDRTCRQTKRRTPRAIKVLGALGVCAALGVAPALAAWSTTGTGTTTIAARSLLTPAQPNVAAGTPAASTLVVSGTLPAGQLAGTTYAVKRGATTVCAPTTTPWSCNDTGLTGSTAYSYTLVASLGAWTATSAAGTGTTQCSAPDTYVVTPSTTTPTAGVAFTVSLTAKKCDGATDTGYTGSKAVTWTGMTASPSGKNPVLPATNVTFVAGTASLISFTSYDAGPVTLTATQGTVTGTSATITVKAGALRTLGLGNVTNSKGGAVSYNCGAATDLPLARTCSQTSGSATGTATWTGTLQLLDTWGNLFTTTTALSVGGTYESADFDPNPFTIPAGSTGAQFVMQLTGSAIADTYLYVSSGTRSITFGAR
jgi:hypothetical protein